jgi:hypothetical protein
MGFIPFEAEAPMESHLSIRNRPQSQKEGGAVLDTLSAEMAELKSERERLRLRIREAEAALELHSRAARILLIPMEARRPWPS